MQDWQSIIASAGERTAAQCRDNTSATPPRVAVCVTGAARTFASRIMLSSLRHHLLEPLCNGNKSGSALFLYLKTRDSDKNGVIEHSPIRFASRTTAAEHIATALRIRWLRELLHEAVIINGSNSYAGRGWLAAEDVLYGQYYVGDPMSALREPDVEHWRSYSGSPTCKPPFGTKAVKAAKSGNSGDERHTGGGAVPAAAVPFAANNQEERMVEAALGLKWCSQAIQRAEARRGEEFTVVAFMRPDLLLPAPIPGWCKWPYEQQVFACAVLGGDSLMITPRRHLARFASQANAHARCAPTDPWHNHGTHWERYMVRANMTSPRDPACCGPPESLLYHTLASRGIKRIQRAFSIFHLLVFSSSICMLDSRTRCCSTQTQPSALPLDSTACGLLRVYNEHFLRRVEHGGTASEAQLASAWTGKVKERSTKHVCDVALHPLFETSRNWREGIVRALKPGSSSPQLMLACTMRPQCYKAAPGLACVYCMLGLYSDLKTSTITPRTPTRAPVAPVTHAQTSATWSG